ncbi:peptidase inhibitor 16, partial [Trichonephila clavata]
MGKIYSIVFYLCVLLELHSLVHGYSANNVEINASVTEPPKYTNSYVNHLENAVNLEGIELKPKPLISSPKFEEISGSVPLQLRYDNRNHDRDRGFNQEIKKQILDLHNLYRSNVTPPAGNMAFMEWDERLEHLAQLYADECVFAHGYPRDKTYPHGDYGQNLYIGHDRSGYLGLWMWYEEYEHYDCKTRVCKPEEECGHYIQMAWGKSSRLGCGVRRCGFRYLIVCHYYPRALDGQQMYIIAKPCSQCSNALCRNNLCVSHEQCKKNPKVCETAKCNLKCQNCGLLDKKACKCTCADGWDSPDCSRVCKDDHQRCGMNPGFPTKASCSLNNFAIAKKYCRKMCRSCNPLIEHTIFNHVCCERKLCGDGYVLNLKSKPCSCTLL